MLDRNDRNLPWQAPQGGAVACNAMAALAGTVTVRRPSQLTSLSIR
ncbi:MAG: hypothetical protein IPK28_07670 [Devosia sp.]|nr:hypothetical protein [Devosia sp.]